MCELNLWGIETEATRPSPPRTPQCELNLWGIETKTIPTPIYRTTQVWIEPVRDWNTAFGRRHCNAWCVWIEPVRDWNRLSYKRARKATPVWIEPVRDWNEKNFTSKINISFGCELNLWGIETYSGNWLLKHPLPCELNLWGIEAFFLLYKFLQLASVWIEPVRDWNLQLMRNLCKNQRVWIEPVRDWNKRSSHKFNFGIIMCELNLWGIETSSIAGTRLKT